MSQKFNLGIEQKKGDPKVLKGKLIAYATVDTDSTFQQNHLEQMIRNGILAVQANYVDQRNIRDFFQAEFGVSLEKGIQEIIDQAKDSGGLEGALDPEVVREKMESMRNMEFIPIPAKIAFFESEKEILSRDEDVFFLGHFKSISHAQLSVNAFPILYQAHFREQEHNSVSQEIESMLKELEGPSPSQSKTTSKKTINNFEGDLVQHLMKELVPNMLYNRENKEEFEQAKTNFDSFMEGFGFPTDTQEIVNLIQANLQDGSKKLEKLQLLVEKIVALHNEDYEKLDTIKRKIKRIS